MPACSKLAVKLIQRIGLVFLRPCLAAWRYRKGQRSNIAANLGGDGAGSGAAGAGGAAGAVAAVHESQQAAEEAAEAATEAGAEEDVEHAEQLEGALPRVQWLDAE